MFDFVILNNGVKMPSLGFGTSGSKENDVQRSVQEAVKAGYRLIDTAYVYGNEKDIGSALECILKDGSAKRDELFVCTKLAPIHQDPKHVEHGCKLSLKHLGLDYLDLYLIHFPIGRVYRGDDVSHKDACDVDFVDTWRAMEDLVNKGLVRSIGISNFNIDQTKTILDMCKIKPAVTQMECHPQLVDWELINFCKENKIILMAYCPLGRPKTKREQNFLDNKELAVIAGKYQKSPAQICLRYLKQIGVVSIPKSVTTSRISENFDIFNFEITDEDCKTMETFNIGNRLLSYEDYKDHKYYPF